MSTVELNDTIHAAPSNESTEFSDSSGSSDSAGDVRALEDEVDAVEAACVDPYAPSSSGEGRRWSRGSWSERMAKEWREDARVAEVRAWLEEEFGA